MRRKIWIKRRRNSVKLDWRKTMRMWTIIVVVCVVVAFMLSGLVYAQYIPYERSLYKHWIDDDGDCQDTRQEVLVRDHLRFGTKNLELNDKGCRVLSGSWYDPYAGQIVSSPKELDVDHVVPLKHAHQMGAWAWQTATRTMYANYMGDRSHLLAVSASENRKKGARGPDEYMPPNEAFHCEYVHIWLKIKKRWKLGIADKEMKAINKVLEKCDDWGSTLRRRNQ